MLRKTVTFAGQPTTVGKQLLQAEIWSPGPGADLLVWVHSGGFIAGSRLHRSHDLLAEEIGKVGYATAFIDYRLARSGPVLQPETLDAQPDLQRLSAANSHGLNPKFHAPRALAAMEDTCAFLNWISMHGSEFDLSGRLLLGGSSAGAITALNTLLLAPMIGLQRPEIETVFSFSGGYAYGDFQAETSARILAINSESDERIDIQSIRALAAKRGPTMQLIEEKSYQHGEICLTPAEPIRDAVARMVAFDQPGAGGDPLSVPGTLLPRGPTLSYSEIITSFDIRIPFDPRLITPRIEAPLRRNRYETGEVRAMRSILRNGDRLLELGSGIGLLSTIAAKPRVLKPLPPSRPPLI